MDDTSELPSAPLQAPGRYRPIHPVLSRVVVIATSALVAFGIGTISDLIGGVSPSAPVGTNRSDVAPTPLQPSLSQPVMPRLVSTRLTEEPQPDVASQFIQTWRVSGPEICSALREAGIATSEWRTASMRSTTYECYFQRVYRQTDARPLSSTYVKIKGNARGEVFEIRGKILGPRTAADGRLDPDLMRLFETMVQKLRWNDLQETLGPIRSLRDVDYRRFGASFRFSRDEANENGYNFALNLDASPGPQARTRQYFSSDRWARAPDPPMSDALPPALLKASR